MIHPAHDEKRAGYLMDEDKQDISIELPDGTTLPLRKDEGGETAETADTAPRPAIDPERLAAAARMMQPAFVDAEWASNARAAFMRPLTSVVRDAEWAGKVNAILERSNRAAQKARQALGGMLAGTTLNEAMRVMHRTSTRMENNYQALSNAGYSEEEIDRFDNDGVLYSTARVASVLQCKVGYCPVGDALAERLREHIAAAKREDSSKNMGYTSNLADIKYRRLRDLKNGTQPLTVDESAQLAIGYGITPAELLGFMDAEEVRLLDLWRGMSAESRDTIHRLMEQLSAQGQHNS